MTGNSHWLSGSKAYYCTRILIISWVFALRLSDPWRVGLMPAVLVLVFVAVRIDPQLEPGAPRRPTSCCKHFRHHTAAWVSVCVNMRVLMCGRSLCICGLCDKPQDIRLGPHEQEKSFWRLPATDSMEWSVQLQMSQAALLYSLTSTDHKWFNYISNYDTVIPL